MHLPSTYPPQPLAKVTVVWGVITKLNSPGTSTVSDTIVCNTNLTNYVSDVPASAKDVYTYWQSQIALGADVEIHWSINLENPTAPPAPMGAYVQAKQHLDGHMSEGNVVSVLSIQDPILNNIAFLQKISKY